MVALLSLRPYRRAIFSSLDWISNPAAARAHTAPHLTQEFGRYWLVTRNARRMHPRKVFGKVGGRFGAMRGKGGGKFAPERLDVPSDLENYVTLYLTSFRLILLGGEHDDGALWLSEHGHRLSSLQIYKDISAATHLEFGHSCAPQLFRDSYATTVQARDPDMAAHAHHTLGHTPRMTHDRYITPSPSVTIAVGRRVAAIMDQD